MSWWLARRAYWQKQQALVIASHPNAQWYEDRPRQQLVCDLWVWPYPPRDELQFVIADLERQRPVSVGDHGQLRHDPDCQEPHELLDRSLGLLLLPETWVLLRLTVPRPPAFPRLYAVDPPVTREATPEFPHLLHDDAACVLYTPDQSWDAARGDGIDAFLRLGMFWVFKTMVWLATRGQRSFGIWLGPDTSGDARDDLELVAPADPCVCTSGRSFRQCCRPRVVLEALRLNQAGIPRLPVGSGRSMASVEQELRSDVLSGLSLAPRRQHRGG
jgi:hypothetical protein